MEDQIPLLESRASPVQHQKTRNYSIEDPLYNFLYKYDLDNYYGDLRLQGVTYENLPYLKRENLLAIPIGPRNRLLQQIKQFQDNTSGEEEQLCDFIQSLIDKQQELLEAFNQHKQIILELQQNQTFSLSSELNNKTKHQQIVPNSPNYRRSNNLSPLRMEWRRMLKYNNR